MKAASRNHSEEKNHTQNIPVCFSVSQHMIGLHTLRQNRASLEATRKTRRAIKDGNNTNNMIENAVASTLMRLPVAELSALRKV